MAKAIHPDQTLTPDNLRELIFGALMEAKVRGCTHMFFAEFLADTQALTGALSTLECVARVQRIMIKEAPERSPPPLEAEITDFLTKIQNFRLKIHDRLLLLAECKTPEDTVS